MKIKYRLLIVIVSISTVVQAQDIVRLSVKDAQNIGLQNRFDIKAKKYDLQKADKKTKEKKQAYIPDVKATGYMHYSPQIQATLIPPGFGGLNEATVLALGAKSTSIFGMELNQPLYKPVLATDIKLAQNNELIQQEQLHLQEIEVKKQISYTYLNVLLRQLQYRIAAEEQRRFEDYSKLAKGRYENGVLIENDYLRANLDYKNAQQQTRISKQNYDQSLITLKYQLNLPDNTKIELTDKLGVQNEAAILVPDYSAAENRTEYRLLKLDEEYNLLLEKKQKRSVLPTLSFVANYSQQYLNADFNYNYTNGKWWSPFSGIGLQLTIPLTAHITNETSVQQIQFENQQILARQQQQKQDAIYEIGYAATEIANASDNYAKAEKNYELAKQIYQNQKQQLNLGAFSYDVILNTESSVTNAERNYIEASYNYIMTQLNYDIAMGKL